MEWGEFLQWGGTVEGILFIIGFLMSYAVEYFPKYGDLAPKWKRLTFIGLAFLISGVVLGLGILSGFTQWVDFPTTLWPALVAGAMAAFGGTVAHTRKL